METNRYELVYLIHYIEYGGNKKTEKKWMEVRRMNDEIWREPLETRRGYLTLKDSPSKRISYTKSDIICFLKWGMESFLKYQAQVLYFLIIKMITTLSNPSSSFCCV